MKNHDDHSNYNKAVTLYLKRDLAKLRLILKSNSLNRIEKKLITARLLNLDNLFKESLELLDSIKTASLYLLAQKHLVAAVIYGRQSMFQHSAAANHNALDCYKEMKDQGGIFQSAFNLCVDYSRLSLKVLFEQYWEIANKNKLTFSHNASLVRVKASFYSKEGNYEEALTLLENLAKEREYKLLDNYETFDNLKADILFRLKDFNGSLLIYKELCRNKKSLIRPRVLYETAILESLLKNKPLPQVHISLETTSEYYLLWKCLISLEDGGPDLAYDYWQGLMVLNPDKYIENFSFKDEGDKNNHFSVFYQMLKSKNKSYKYLKMGKKGNVFKLLKVLEEAEVPLRKEVLIERVWETSYAPSFDARFYKLIQRLKNQYNLNVVMEKSTYRIS